MRSGALVQRLARQDQRLLPLALRFFLLRHRRFEHGALAFAGLLVDQLGADLPFENGQRIVPLALRGAMVEHGFARPGERREPVRLFGEMQRRGLIAAPLRLDMQAAQAEQPRRRIGGEFVEGRFGRGAIAGELRRLRAEEQRQRLLLEVPAGLGGGFAREMRIAGAHRDHAA